MNKKIERIAYISKITNICNVAFDDPKPLNSTVAINFLVNNHCTENSLTNSNPYLLKMCWILDGVWSSEYLFESFSLWDHVTAEKTCHEGVFVMPQFIPNMK